MRCSGAERQAAWRQRQADRATTLEAVNAQLLAETGALHADLAGALAEHTRLRVELADVCAQLADALAECERLAGACRHPAAAVEVGICHACGTDV